MAAPHVKLNRGVSTGTAKATDLLPQLTRAYERSLRAAGRRAAARFRQTETIRAAANPDPPNWIPPPALSLVDQTELADDTQRKTSRLHGRMLTAATTPALESFGVRFDITAPVPRAILDAYAIRIQQTITSAIAEQITEAIRDGYAAGKSVAQVSRAIQAATDSISRVRADMLARSDLNGIANAGSLYAASVTGAAGTKTWTTAGDERVRPDHEDADGQTVAIADDFDIGGESAQFPGDSQLSWEQSANCRCTLTYGNPLTSSGERVAEPRDFASWRDFGWEGAYSSFPPETSIAAAASKGNFNSGVLYLARHALTAYDSDDHASDTIRGWADDPLTDAGETEAKRLAASLDGLGITSVAGSDLQRASDTADWIADGLDLLATATDALRPWNLGDFQGRAHSDARDEIAAYVDAPDEPVPGGESFNEFCSRFLPAVSEAMAQTEAGASPLLVTHSHNMKLARAWIRNGRQPVNGADFMADSPGPASVLAVDPADAWSVTEILCDGRELDETGHVPAAVHYRPATDPDRECATCDFYSAGRCSMFSADVIADYVCDEWLRLTNAVTSGGTMTAIEIDALTLTERAELAARLAEPLSASAERMARVRDRLKEAGLGGTFADDELSALAIAVNALTSIDRAQFNQLTGITPRITLHDVTLLAATTEGTPWLATLCVADEPTVDSGIKRVLAAGGGSWLPLPLPLGLLDDTPHADVTTKSPVCGRIDQIWAAGNVYQASGIFLDAAADPKVAEAGSKAASLVDEMRRMGVSVDLVDTEVEMCAWGNGGEIVPKMDTANDPTARNYDSAVDPNAPGGPATQAEEIDDADGDEPEYVMLFRRWVIGGATICPVQALTQATISLVAGSHLGHFDPFVASGFVGKSHFRWYHDNPGFAKPEPVLTASAAGLAPTHPPAAWFEMDEIDTPTPLTVTDEGQVYGHMALWDTCHTGFADRCVPPPRSPSNYSNFHLGDISTAEGTRIAIGTLTMKTGHAGHSLSANGAIAHYDNTGTAAAYVRASDGKYGIWVSGTLSAELDAVDAQALMAAKPSGDWREVFRGKGRDMIGALMVNVPGFIVPRTLTAAGLPYGDESVEFSSECAPCEESLARELAVLAAAADGIAGLAALVEA